MVGRKKKPKICDKVLEEDVLSQLPGHLISEILTHLSTKDAVRTSVLSIKWRNLWQLVPGLDLDSNTFSNIDAFWSFAERFFDQHKESCIRKLRLNMYDFIDDNSFLTRWIDAVSTRKIQHQDLRFCTNFGPVRIPSLSLYTCETMLHLQLRRVALVNAEFVSLPCLKIMHLENVHYLNESTLQKLISGSPVLEDLTIIRVLSNNVNFIQIRSQTLKRIDIDHQFRVVIDAPLLQFLRTKIYTTKNFEIINLGYSTKLDIDVVYLMPHNTSLIHGILTDISRVRELVIGSKFWKLILLYLKSTPVLQFRQLSHLNARICISDLETLPNLLESSPKLESLTLELVKYPYMRRKKKKEPNLMFSTVPQCLVSSLKFVELKRSISGYEGEIELVRYFLKNSTILEKLKVDVYYKSMCAKCAFLKEVNAMPRCSSRCEVLVL